MLLEEINIGGRQGGDMRGVDGEIGGDRGDGGVGGCGGVCRGETVEDRGGDRDFYFSDRSRPATI